MRRERRLLLAEGEDLIEAGLARGAIPVALMLDEERVGADDPLIAATSDLSERYLVAPALLGRSSTLATPPRAMAIFRQPEDRGFRDVAFPPSLGVWLTAVADPGNVGTLLRTAAALGADWLALGPGSADPFHHRAARAAMGATFALPLLIGVRAADLATREGFRVIAAAPRGGAPPWEIDFGRPSILALGAERAGVEPALGGFPADRTDWVTIPQTEGAESLNVAAAGAALLAEASRQRAGASG